MGDLNISQLLEKLDFNAIHCGDLVAREYFRESAIALRMLERERDHYRHASQIERVTNLALRRDAAELSAKIAALEILPGSATRPTAEATTATDDAAPSVANPERMG